MKYVIIGLLVLAVVVSGCVSNTGQTTASEEIQKPISSYYKNTDISACKNLEKRSGFTNDVVFCFVDLAIKNNDLSVCQRSGVANIPGLLEGLCYRFVAEANNDSSICSRMYEVCNNNSLCITAYVSERINDCYNGVAVTTKNSSLCENVTNSTIKQECYLSVEISKTCGNNVCDGKETYTTCKGDCKITTNECLQWERSPGYEFKYNEPECKDLQLKKCLGIDSELGISEGLQQPTCLTYLASEYKDARICDFINTRILKDNDWYCKAKVTGDRYYCSFIDRTSLQKLCIDVTT